MDVVKSNQFYSSSLRLFYNSILSQQQFQLDSKLIAFYTILTVALSVILLSLNKRHHFLVTTTTVYALPYSFVLVNEVKKCFRCLRCLNVRRYYKNIYSASTGGTDHDHDNNSFYNISKNYCLNCTQNKIKYLKLKRLRSIAAAVTKFTCRNYWFNPLNNNLLRSMKRTKIVTTLRLSRKSSSNIQMNLSASSTSSIGSGMRKREAYSSSVDMLSAAAAVAANDILDDSSHPTLPDNLNSCQSCPVFNSVNSQENGSMRRSRSLPKINSRVRLYKKLPLRTMSRAWGEINSIDLPVWFRKPCFYVYSWIFNCNLQEIAIEDITEFRNLSEFFRRSLKPDARLIDQRSCMVSPCDGRILNFGRVDKGYLEQVKGVNYSLRAFLGEQTWPKNVPASQSPSGMVDLDDPELYEKSILYNPEANALYHCVIYLAPGDYHRFHSPTDWEMFYRRHFPGELFSVNPSVARWLQGLFNLNERVVYYGQWKYGFFSMSPVGATNVGSIRVYTDPEMTTNNKTSHTFEKDLEKSFCATSFTASEDEVQPIKGVKIKRGEDFGEFNLGSTIVLIFEAPKNFEFNVNPGEKVLFGSKLGSAVFSSSI